MNHHPEGGQVAGKHAGKMGVGAGGPGPAPRREQVTQGIGRHGIEIAKGTGTALWLNFEHWVEDGSFIKMRELAATYRFQPGWLGVQDLAFSFVGRNLFSIDNYTGYDPEVNTGGQRTGTRGFEFIEVPIPRGLSLGVTATF